MTFVKSIIIHYRNSLTLITSVNIYLRVAVNVTFVAVNVTCQSSNFQIFPRLYKKSHLFPGSSLHDFYKVIPLSSLKIVCSTFIKSSASAFLRRSSLPRDLIAERAFPVFNENQSIKLALAHMVKAAS